METIKIIAIFFIFLTIGSMILLGLGKIKSFHFFLIAAVSGFVAFKIIPKMKK